MLLVPRVSYRGLHVSVPADTFLRRLVGRVGALDGVQLRHDGGTGITVVAEPRGLLGVYAGLGELRYVIVFVGVLVAAPLLTVFWPLTFVVIPLIVLMWWLWPLLMDLEPGARDFRVEARDAPDGCYVTIRGSVRRDILDAVMELVEAVEKRADAGSRAGYAAGRT